MINRKFTATAVSKAIAYANAGAPEKALVWFRALEAEIDPKGDFKRTKPGHLKDADIEQLEAFGHPVPKLIKKAKANDDDATVEAADVVA